MPQPRRRRWRCPECGSIHCMAPAIPFGGAKPTAGRFVSTAGTRTRWIMKTIIEGSGRMHNPAHPGEILKEMYMGPLGVTITQTADALGVSRKHVSAIVNGRVPVSPDMAARLAGVFGTEPDIWINLQAQYDLWQVRQHGRPKVKRLAA